ncbi:MAG: PAS domain-containing sensor histidine kinase [Pseudomonadota bacterium]
MAAETDLSTPASSASSSARRLRRIAICLLLVQAGALGLKAWEERQSADLAALAVMEREALAVAERLSGRVGSARTALRVAADAGRLSRAENVTDAIEDAAVLRDALTAPEGGRRRAAAETAAGLRDRGEEAGLSALGDIVVLSSSSRGTEVIAYGMAETWMPAAAGNRRFALHAEDGVGLAGVGALERMDPTETGFQRQRDGERRATACAPVPASNLSLCSSAPAPLFAAADLARVSIYLLLFAAPALAILSLFGALAGRRAAPPPAASAPASSEPAHNVDFALEGAQAGVWERRDGEPGAVINDQYAKMLGVEGGGLLTDNAFLKLVYEEDRPRMSRALDTAMDGGEFRETFRTYVSSGKSWVELRGRETRASKPGERHVAGLALDVTERTLTEERLKIAERRLRAALEGFTGPVALWDKRNRLLFWNPAFEDLFGLSGQLRLGISYDTVSVARAAAIREEKFSDFDKEAELLQLASGKWLQIVKRPTPDGGSVTIGVDVTENLQSQSQLERQRKKLKQLVAELEVSQGQAEENARKYEEAKRTAENAAEAKSSFLANMSHELRTPLNAINGFSEILANELFGPLGDKRYEEYARDIHAAGGHLLDMINDILDMSKIEAGKMTIDPKPIDPVDPVDAAVRILRRRAEEKGVRLVLRTGRDLGEIEADHRAMRQMVINLTANALKFTDAGGDVTVTVERANGEILITVADTGVGIPAEHLPRLAQPFEQVRDTTVSREGTGLGLALTKSFAEMHGGRLEIESEVGRGTTVRIRLPAIAAKTAATDAA